MPIRAQPILILLLFLTPGAVPAQDQSPPFRDDLLDHLVGEWDASGLVHGTPSKQTFKAEWVLNHQFLRVMEKSTEKVAGQSFPFEGVFFFGYDNTGKHYVVHLMTVWGGDSDSLGVGERKGNELKIAFSYGNDSVVNRFIWQPDTKRWRIVVQDGKSERPPYVDLEATSVRASTSRP